MVEISKEKYEQELNDLKEKISELRKKGYNTKIAELFAMRIPAKIKLVMVTKTDRDMKKLQYLISSLKSELDELGAKKPMSERDLLEEAQKVYSEQTDELENKEKGKTYEELGEHEIIERTNKLINEANNYLNNKIYDKCLHNYLEIQNVYKYLPRALKKKYYEESIKIYRGLSESGLFNKLRELKKESFFGKLIRVSTGIFARH
ncbi:MAG: hypothetical protein U9O94_00210 [Nanoarchaeota archaeon]|nr:hypothetical protein [Nanoarchaeota archaeon]